MPSELAGKVRRVAFLLARADPGLGWEALRAALVAVARREGRTPRSVVEELFKLAPSDEEWRRDFLPLFSEGAITDPEGRMENRNA